MALPTILIVDDDRYWARHYIERLRDNLNGQYEVLAAYSAGDAVSFVTGDPTIVGIVLDIMMPPPPNVELVMVDDGELTGVHILSECRDTIIKRSICVFVLTNKRLPDVIAEIEKLDVPEDLLQCAQKYDVSAKMLPDRLKSFLRRSKNSL